MAQRLLQQGIREKQDAQTHCIRQSDDNSMTLPGARRRASSRGLALAPARDEGMRQDAQTQCIRQPDDNLTTLAAAHRQVRNHGPALAPARGETGCANT
jgi:hypothetical protein